MSFQKGSISSLIELLEHVFEDIDAEVSIQQLLSISSIIYNAMTGYTRLYHNLNHVLNFSTPDDPITHIAALFHDIVYYQVDKGFYRDLEPVIYRYIREKNSEFYLDENFGNNDQLEISLGVLFDKKPGQVISISDGLNEFLSALVMVNLLKGIVPNAILFKAAVCIEATIPFRGLDDKGKSHFEILYSTLQEIGQKADFDFKFADTDTTLIRAVLFSNKDVESFADENVGRFLENTWKLLPESNIALRSRGTYTIREYRLALENMDAFLGSLSAGSIFSKFKDIPDDTEYQTLIKRAQRNLSISRQYLQIKLIASSVLEVLAEFSGGDAPLSLFVGDLPRPAEKFKRLEDFLPHLEKPEFIDTQKDEVYQLLDSGRFGESSFDSKNSPLSLYLYKCFTKQEIEKMYKYAQMYFHREMPAFSFIEQIPPRVRTAVIKGCASMAYYRREKLLTLIANNT